MDATHTTTATIDAVATFILLHQDELTTLTAKQIATDLNLSWAAVSKRIQEKAEEASADN